MAATYTHVHIKQFAICLCYGKKEMQMTFKPKCACDSSSWPCLMPHPLPSALHSFFTMSHAVDPHLPSFSLSFSHTQSLLFSNHKLVLEFSSLLPDIRRFRVESLGFMCIKSMCSMLLLFIVLLLLLSPSYCCCYYPHLAAVVVVAALR